MAKTKQDYQLGDRVLDKDDDEAIVIRVKKDYCTIAYFDSGIYPGSGGLMDKKSIRPDLYNIEKPFCFCGESVQEALKQSWNGNGCHRSNIEYLNDLGSWVKTIGRPCWTSSTTYRLVGKSKQPREVTMEEVIKQFGEEVVITKENR